jgi:hypothetical protein
VAKESRPYDIAASAAIFLLSQIDLVRLQEQREEGPGNGQQDSLDFYKAEYYIVRYANSVRPDEGYLQLVL